METKTKEVKAYFQDQLKEKFNEEKFNQDVKAGKKISFWDINEYRKKEDDEKKEMFDTKGLSFRGGLKNGEYVAVGSNGHVIKSKNLDDFNRKLAQVFKIHALKKRKEPFCHFCMDKNKKEEEKTKLSESFARAFINAGVVVAGDVPKSPKFWEKLKQDYLAKEGHTLDNWNRLTRFVPKEYMLGKEKSIQSQKNIRQTRTNAPQKAPSFAVMGRSQGGR